MQTIYEQFMAILEQAIEKHGNMTRLARAVGVHPNLITRWRKRQFMPCLDTIQPILDDMGISFIAAKVNNCTADMTQLEQEVGRLHNENDKLREELIRLEARSAAFQEVLGMLQERNGMEEKNNRGA